MIGVVRKMMHEVKIAREKYTYNPETGELYSKRFCRVVHKNCLVNGRQLRPYQVAFLIMEGYLPETIDHADGNRNNNRWENLRPATCYQQCANTRKIGIRKWPSGKYYYQLMVEGVRYYESGFKTAADAQESYDNLCLRLQGEYAVQQRSSE